jgi:hypothetical protein
VEGVRWPVKQAFSLVTGADSSRFVSLTARRHFSKLGFPVSGDSIPRSTGSRGPRQRASVDPEQMLEIDRVEAELAFARRHAGDVTLDGTGAPQFPVLPHLPGLYRFQFDGRSNDKTVLYIGESGDIARRASNYRNAETDRSRPRTSRRIHQELVAHLLAGGTVAYSIATDVVMGADDQSVDLRLKSARRMAENAAVLLAQLKVSRVLNIDADLSEPDSGDDDGD